MMNLFDIIILAICSIFLARGVWIGFVRQISFIAALGLGFIAAGRFHETFSHLLGPFIANQQLSFLLTFLLLFLLVYIIVMLVGVVFRKVMQVTFLGWFDRLLGGLFGLAKAVLIANIIFILLSPLLSSSNTFLRHSFFYPYLKESSQFLLSLIQEEEVRRGFHPKEPAIKETPSPPGPPPMVKPIQQTGGNPEDITRNN